MPKFRTKMRLCAAVSIAGVVAITSACSNNNSNSNGDPAGSSGAKAAPGVTKTSIELGTTNGLTGGLSAPCTEVSKGAQAWFDTVNGQGGIAGRKIHVTVKNDNNEAPTAVQNVRGFIDKPVFAVFGGCGSIAAGAIYNTLDKAGIPYLFPDAAFDALVKPVHKYVFAVAPSYAVQAQELIKYAATKYGKGSVMAVIGKLPGYEDQISALKSAAQSSGLQWVEAEATPNGTSDYSPIALKIAQKKPTYLYLNVGGPDGARLVNALEGLNAVPPHVLGGTGEVNETFVDPGGYKLGDKFLGGSVIASPDDPAAKDCADSIRAAGLTPDGNTLWGCSAAQLLTSALQKVGPDLTRDSLVRALEGLSGKISGPLAPIGLSATNHIAVSGMFVAAIKGKKLAITSDVIPLD